MQQLQAAVALHKQGELDKAEAIYQQVLAVDVNNFYALNFCGSIKREKKRFDEGIDFLSRAISLQPDNPDAIYNLGNVFKDSERWDEAISCYEKTLGLRAESPEALNNLGICLKEVERFEYSEIVLRRVVSMQPGLAGAWLNLGNTFKEQEKYSEAKASYRNAIDLKPDFEAAYFALGLVLKEEGKVEEAIASYRKAIELKPDFADVYFALGLVLKEAGEFEAARQIVSALSTVNAMEDSTLLSFSLCDLVFDWYHRRVLNLLEDVEMTALSGASAPFSAYETVRKIQPQLFPPLFLKGEGDRANEKHLYRNGYLVEDEILPEDLCAEFVNGFEGANAMSAALIRAVSEKGVLGSVLGKIFKHTDFPHLVWNCIYFAKGPDDQAISDAWHYDNHYNVWTPKLMIYLNSQREEGGATEFVDTSLSRRLSEETDYMGFIWQRESYADRVKGSVKDLGLDPATLDPDHYTFSPDHAGSGVWFCPSRVLHRGVSPKKGVRHVLSFSLTPLPHDCGWSIDQCVDKSIEILQDKINKGMQKSDVNPYWIPAEAGYA
ncbi:TPR repeat [Prochlorococcus marinus str. MIT 9313]|uniref:TPR repeat n=2 Tax=Prochlorococcus marinus TaxID=1219 RepID=Q7V4X6_PROMM|nr:TPR repeat [Prochlorococcus marinus str. MIT 9313]